MNQKEKVQVLRNALGVFVFDPRIRMHLESTDPKALGQARNALDLTVSRQQMTPEQKVIDRAQRRFERSQDRIIRNLRSVGIRKGSFGIHKETGARVAFVSEPTSTPTGFEITVQDAAGKVVKVNALAYRPDYENIDLAVAKKKAPTVPAPAVKPAVQPATRPLRAAQKSA